ncbi:MAG: BspA family leucine-rich repeat surface protein [Spirosomataceae bacterium]
MYKKHYFSLGALSRLRWLNTTASIFFLACLLLGSTTSRLRSGCQPSLWQAVLFFLLVGWAGSSHAQCWKAIAAGGTHNVGIKADGTLWAWGYNYFGQLGDGTTTTRISPTKIGTDTDWKAVVCGSGHTLALKTDGTLYAWGYNARGQLGDGSTTNKNSPTKIGTDTYTAIACGGTHSLALRTDGTLWAWGNNSYGQLGDGTIDNKNSPTKIGTDTDWKAIAGGEYHSLAIKTGGNLWAWGKNAYGQLGDGTTIDKNSPTKIGTDTDWKAVACGQSYSLTLKTDGTLWAWGDNSYGQLGNGTLNDKTTPTKIGTATDWKAVACGHFHILALKTDGTLWAWGYNANGQLGDGTTDDKYSPTKIGTDTDWDITAGGSNHSLALKTDGDLSAWGNNASGQFGDGTTTGKKTPTAIACPGVSTLTIGTALSPTNCTTPNGSIAFRSTGIAGGSQTLNYKKDEVAASATVTVDAYGNFTLSGLSAGVYSNFAIGSTNATGTNPTLEPPVPNFTPGTIASVSNTATSFTIPVNSYSIANQYSLVAVTPMPMPGFAAVTNAPLPPSAFSLTVTIPPSAAGTYNFNLTVSNSTTGCVSANIPITLTVFSPFITRWDLSKTGSSTTGLTIPMKATTGQQVSYTWTTVPAGTSGAGTFTSSGLTLTGLPAGAIIDLSIAPTNLESISMGAISVDSRRLVEIRQWGDVAWTSMESAFSGCANMTLTATDVPNTAAVTNMSGMFAGCSSFNQALPATFNTSNVTNMSRMFADCIAYNKALPSSFDTKNVTDMSTMFSGCSAYNQALPSSFNTAKVTNMGEMFGGCSRFDQALPNSFNTTAVTDMSYMFYACSTYNQALPSSFKTAAVTDMSNMFAGCTAFNQSLASFTLNAGVNLANFLDNTGLSVANYDATLTAFNAQNVTGRSMGAAGLKYCASEADRANLVKTVANGGKSWTITDGGKLCSPTITVSGPLGAFFPCSGTASAEQSFTVGGSNLTNNITITAPTDYEVSTTSGSGFGTSINLPQNGGGSVASTTIYVRTAANATLLKRTLTLSSPGATDQLLYLTGGINPLPSLSPSPSPAICAGASSFTIPYTNPSASPTTYSISGTGITSVTNGNLPASPITVNLSAGASGSSIAYTLTVKNANGCTSSAITGNVTVKAKPNLQASTTTPSVCVGQSINLSADLFTPPTSGTASTAASNVSPTNYAWAGPTGSSFTTTAQNPNATASSTAFGGVYSVTVTSNGCSASATTSVSVKALPVPAAGSTTPSVCVGQSISLTASPAGASYAWAGPAGSDYTSDSQNPSVVASSTAFGGRYTLTVTSNGCSASATTSVSVIAGPTAFLVSGGGTVCNSTVSVLLSGSQLNVNYLLKRDNLPVGSPVPGTGNPLTFPKLALAGTYTIEASNTSCSVPMTGSASIVVVNPDANFVSSSGKFFLCPNATLTLSAPPQQNVAFEWSLGTSVIPNSNKPSLTVTQAGPYTLKVTGLGSCKLVDSKTIYVQVPTPVSYSASATVTAAKITLTANPTGQAYTWSGPSAFSSTVRNPVINAPQPTNAGVYTVAMITPSTGCAGSATVSVVLKAPRLGSSDDDNTDSVLMTAFPNPATKFVTVEIRLAEPSSLQLYLYNAAGQPVGTWEMPEETTLHRRELDLGSIKDGLYLIQAQSKYGKQTKRIVKME